MRDLIRSANCYFGLSETRKKFRLKLGRKLRGANLAELERDSHNSNFMSRENGNTKSRFVKKKILHDCNVRGVFFTSCHRDEGMRRGNCARDGEAIAVDKQYHCGECRLPGHDVRLSRDSG